MNLRGGAVLNLGCRRMQYVMKDSSMAPNITKCLPHNFPLFQITFTLPTSHCRNRPAMSGCWAAKERFNVDSKLTCETGMHSYYFLAYFSMQGPFSSILKLFAPRQTNKKYATDTICRCDTSPPLSLRENFLTWPPKEYFRLCYGKKIRQIQHCYNVSSRKL